MTFAAAGAAAQQAATTAAQEAATTAAQEAVVAAWAAAQQDAAAAKTGADFTDELCARLARLGYTCVPPPLELPACDHFEYVLNDNYESALDYAVSAIADRGASLAKHNIAVSVAKKAVFAPFRHGQTKSTVWEVSGAFFRGPPAAPRQSRGPPAAPRQSRGDVLRALSTQHAPLSAEALARTDAETLEALYAKCEKAARSSARRVIVTMRDYNFTPALRAMLKPEGMTASAPYVAGDVWFVSVSW